jgi:Family of unknown function (DUF6088)
MTSQRVVDRVARSIGGSGAEVFLRSDFSKIGSYAQVGKALNALKRAGRLVSLGYGVYSKARPSSLSGRPVPRQPLELLAREALEKLDVVAKPGRTAREYIAGSTQIPAQISFDTGRRRISRKLRLGAREVQYENNLR